MRKALVFIQIILTTTACFCQTKAPRFLISNDHISVVYVGLENRLRVLVENTPCDSLIVTTDNGLIIKCDTPRCESNECIFLLRQIKTGHVQVTVKKISLEDTLKMGSYEFSAVDIPEPIICVSGKSEGAITKEDLIKYQVLTARNDLEGIYLSPNPWVLGFNIIIIRKGKVIFYQEIKGNKFSSELKDFIKTLENSDVIIFSNIVVMTSSMKKGKVQPKEFVIIK